jgi:PKD repeat protein
VRGRTGLAALLSAVAIVGCEQLPEIPNVPPVASFVYSPVSPINSGQTLVTFIASGSTDADGQIASYTWNFGDGSAEETRTAPTVTHLFPDTAATCLEIVYTVLLTVTDDKGAKASASQTARVTELPPPTSNECTRR